MQGRGILKGENWVTTNYKDDNGKKVTEIMKMESARFPCWGHYPPDEGHELEFYNEHITKKVDTGVDIEVEDERNGIFWITFWYQGYYNRLPSTRSFIERIKDAYKLLKGEVVHYEEFLLDTDTAEKMGQYLIDKSKEVKSK